MYCFSLWRPYPALIALGFKTIESRRWFSLPRYLVGNRLAIHAAKAIEPGAVEEAMAARGKWFDATELSRIDSWNGPGLVCHGLVAAVRWTTPDDAAAVCAFCPDRRVGIVLADVRRLLEVIPYKGHQGLMTVPDDLILSAHSVSVASV